MASILVRDLDDDVKLALAEQAARHGRSMEAEARAILAEGVRQRPRNIGLALLDMFADGRGEDIEIPERRELARPAEFDE
jgi:plasmid stability protein